MPEETPSSRRTSATRRRASNVLVIDVPASGQAQPSDGGPSVHTPDDKVSSGQCDGDGDCPQKSLSTKQSSENDVKPVWICKMIVHYPKASFGIISAIYMSLVLLTGVLYVTGYDILPINFKDVPLNLKYEDQYLRTQAWLYRDESELILPELFEASKSSERTLQDEGIEVIYDLEGSGNNVFTAENLRLIQEAEKKIMDTESFDQFCWADSSGACIPPVSVIRFFDGTYKDLDPTFLDPDFANIPLVLVTAEKYSITKNQLQYHLGQNSEVDGSQGVARSDITRSLFWTGLPLAGYDNSEDREDEQLAKRDDFFGGPFRDSLWGMTEEGIGDIGFIYSSFTMATLEAQRQVMLDFALAVGSFVFIFAFVCLQTHSLFVTSLALASILTSFCITNLLYRIVFDFRYFGIFHVLSVFIIFGIGADNIFVFYDSWRASAHHSYETFALRLSDCYRRSASAMFVTSFTTTIAFLVNAFSPLLMVNSFGLFSGILVFVNYLSVITFFPTVVVLYHLNFENWSWPCFKFCLSKSTNNSNKVSTTSEDVKTNDEAPVYVTNGCNGHVSTIGVLHSATSSQPTIPAEKCETDNQQTKRKHFIVRFFAGPFYKLITHRIIRWVVLAVFVGQIALFTYYAAQVEPQEEAVKIFKDGHNFGKARTKTLNSFKPSSQDNIVRVYLVWGMKNQDRSNCHKTDFECEGETVWDESFDLNPPPAQVALQDFCKRLKSLTDAENEKLHVRKNVDGEYEIKCFVDNMEAYLEGEMEKSKYATSENLRLPTTPAKVQTLMKRNSDLYSTSVIPDTYYRYFETALNFWLANGYTGVRTYEYDEFHELLGESEDVSDSHQVKGSETHYGTRIRYASIVVNTSLTNRDQGYTTGLPIVENWETFLEQEKAKMPPSLNGGFQCTPELDNEWHWLKVQKVLVQSAWQGIVIGICLALLVLVLATKNLIVGGLATLTICFITITVVGMMDLAGWKLGVLESINLSLVVGLAVDYVVHLAAGYHFAKSLDRRGRVREMLEEVGISVVSGATTTLGASLFMLFAQILFFMQFGLFMFCTIGASMIYALGFFSTLLALVGPENDTGSIKRYVVKARRLITGRPKDDDK